MNHFVELTSEWHDLMHVPNDTSAFSNSDLRFLEEQHVLNLTAKYISKLESIQTEHTSLAIDFAKRVRLHLRSVNVEEHVLVTVCQRVISGVGATLRREIPSSLSRSKRRECRRLVIDWSNDVINASWEGVNAHFPLREVLLFCTEHSGGADERLGEAIVDQLMSELRQGIAVIPRLTWASHGTDRSVLNWESAALTLEVNAASPSESICTNSATQSAIIIYLEDFSNEISNSVYERVAERGIDIKDTNVEVALAIADADEPDDSDLIQQRVNRFATDAIKHFPGTQASLIGVMISAAYSGVAEAIVSGDHRRAAHRACVFKRIKRLKGKLQFA